MSDLLKFKDQIFERPSEKLKIQSHPEAHVESHQQEFAHPEAFAESHQQEFAESPTPVKTREPLTDPESPSQLEVESQAIISAELSRPHLPPRASLAEFGYVPTSDAALSTDEIPRDFLAISENAPVPESTPNKQEIEESVW